MNTRPLTLLFVFTFAMSMLASCTESPPPVDGWRYPNETDIKDDWADENNIKWLPIPYHFSSDLNGDGLSDDAWILISTKSDNEYGVFVFFNQQTDDPKVVQIPGHSGDYPQRIGIRLEPAGTMSESMGGFGIKTKFNHSGIMHFHWEAQSHYIFWNNESNSFKFFPRGD